MKRITRALIERTEDIETLQSIEQNLRHKAQDMFWGASKETTIEHMWSNPAFNSLQLRWEFTIEKLVEKNASRPEGYTPYSKLEFGDILC